MNERSGAPGTLARNVTRVSRLEIPGGGQVVVQGHHAFVGHMKPPHGTSIVDVKDPRHPRVVATIPRQSACESQKAVEQEGIPA